ncbi:hypothetical protein, conserved [Babesia bigemina]|uniref:C3H1-type domain-containing protein n=1 Tax=Babesia bigemina TaxID=5866 RepID=A0A061D8P9_BABBI|nr:hypothetical protein, conserved [Babesia bigemina]CDR96317.1 hypothetical protein, conserved [Babesia bigemina]|eukprot:XP_012768503.1 hypothetical protein, conserved [Babesia bigemina]
MSDCIEAALPESPQDVGDLPPTTTSIDTTTNTICFNTSEMPPSHIVALDQLIQLQCNKLEKQLVALKVKRQLLHMGEGVVLSVNDLVSDVSEDSSKELLSSLEAASVVDTDIDDRFKYFRSQTVGVGHTEDISEIINAMNMRNSSSNESDDFMRRVQFTAVEEPANSRVPISRRCITLPDSHGPVTASELALLQIDMCSAGDVQLMLHIQGKCKPCAFYYNKNKGCRNGSSCVFCHHEDHCFFTLKRWKKQQRQFSQSRSLSREIMGAALNPNPKPEPQHPNCT